MYANTAAPIIPALFVSRQFKTIYDGLDKGPRHRQMDTSDNVILKPLRSATTCADPERRGGGAGGPDPPGKLQKYRIP